MRKNWIYYNLTIVPMACCILCGCNPTGQTIEFRGICTDDVKGEQGLYNPGKGHRPEITADVEEPKRNPAEELVRFSEKYASE